MIRNPAKLPFNEYKSIYSRVPRLCVDLLIRKDEGILLIERAIDPGKGLWHFPGGTVLLGESIEDAAKRIALDETSLSIDTLVWAGTMEFSVPENPYFHTISLVYSVEKISGSLKGGVQGKELAYFKSLPEKMIPEQKDFLHAL